MKKATYQGCACVPSTDPFCSPMLSNYRHFVSKIFLQQPGGISILPCRMSNSKQRHWFCWVDWTSTRCKATTFRRNLIHPLCFRCHLFVKLYGCPGDFRVSSLSRSLQPCLKSQDSHLEEVSTATR